MFELILKINNDIKINKRCLQEKDLPKYTKELLNLWIKYDEELLKIIDNINI